MSEAAARQNRAAAPDRSSWVAANAGSGKTTVLTNRVARLLLAGTDPARVLCLTYTKAAASEMQSRLFRTLGSWAMLDDVPLAAELAKLGEPAETMPPAQLARARTLFARALETPGGLKIQTIHAFCEALLRRFPLEAGVAPQFAVLDDRAARALREAVLDTLAERAPRTLADLAENLSGDDPDPLLREIAQRRAAFETPFDPAALARALGADPSLSPETLLRETLLPEDSGLLEALIPHLEISGRNDARLAQAFREILADTDASSILARLDSALLTGATAAEPFSAKTGSLPTKAIRAAHPDLSAALDALMRRVETARPRRLARDAFEKSAALNRFARHWLTALDARKAALGLLDFDDMIARTCALLSEPVTASWVLWKLDGGLEHILVDEAQDTSPAQWQVVRALSEEFFAGLDPRGRERTVFVVGDEKQSIYSFQGAEPAAFGEMRAHFEARLGALGAELQACDLIHSFRSAAPILTLVDAVFGGRAGQGLGGAVSHAAFDPARAGRVELWPYLPKPEKPVESPWWTPLDAPGDDDPVAVLALRIAERIAGWIDTRQTIPGEDGPRAIRAGDVMILVQRRGALFHAVIRALKRAGVAVAGADVLRMGGELAVKDLLAALRVAATPGDDLSLAALLRSPLGGVSESGLFDLAHARPGSLFEALRARPPESHAPARALLDELRAQADFLRPFELLQRILVRHGGRQRLVARLGTEAEDGIDALLDQALAYESAEAPSLTGFLSWIDRDDVKVKRRSEEGADQVRVMTVHGAKGLEAPVVILPDTALRQEGRNAPGILLLPDGEAAWRMPADSAPPALAGAEAARRCLARAENMRLLYVALTRARHWLIVCGAGPALKPGSDAWYSLVAEAMADLGSETRVDADGETIVLGAAWPCAAAATQEAATPAPAAPPRTPLRLQPAPPRPIAPSSLGGEHVLAGSGIAEDVEAKARGEAIHRLLETLPGRDRGERAAIAARLLPDRPDRDALLAEATALLDAPDLAAIFAPGSLAEVDFSAFMPVLGGARMIGRMDRLVVGADGILAVDFKSNRAVPGTPDAVPEGILRQMGAYRAALAAIWPGRPVATAILWTRTGTLMRLPAALADAALTRAGDLDPAGRRS